MCGIAGFWSPSLAASVRREVVRGMTLRLAHRGPDADGHWVPADTPVALGHRRLSILDLSPSGRMPMASADGRHVLVFNGAIYNYVELRAELAREVPFRSSGDTEVILQGFRVWGWDRLLDRLDGMFAFAL